MNKNEGSIVHIIFQAEKLCHPKTEPGNALLKILEEPPPNTFFILVTNHKAKMIDTILSRCCDFYFPKISNKKIKEYISKYNSIEHIDLLILNNVNKSVTVKLFLKSNTCLTSDITTAIV